MLFLWYDSFRDKINYNGKVGYVSSQYLADKGVFTKTPKTESSIRDVAIPKFVVSLLEEYKHKVDN